MSGKLYCLIGLPRSGKSSLAQSWLHTQIDLGDENYRPRVVVNGDKIRLAMTSERWNYYSEPFVHATELIMIRSFLIAGYSVLVDDTHTTEKSLIEILELDLDTKFIFIKTNPEICKHRAKLSNQEDLIPIIDRMYDNLQKLINWEYAMMDHIEDYIMNKKIPALREKVKSYINNAKRIV